MIKAMGVVTRLPDSCGFGIIYNHLNVDACWEEYHMSYGITIEKLEGCGGGTGINVASFVDEPRCHAVHAWIKENTDVLFTSEPEINVNTGKLNTLVVFKLRAE